MTGSCTANTQQRNFQNELYSICAVDSLSGKKDGTEDTLLKTIEELRKNRTYHVSGTCTDDAIFWSHFVRHGVALFEGHQNSLFPGTTAPRKS